MKKFLLLTLILIAQTFYAQNVSEAMVIPMDNTVRIGTLKNGFKYYIKQNKKPEEKVEFRLVINAGSVLETDEQQGLAHFMEHMNFNGTKNFPKNELVSFLQSIGVEFGADLNAYTSFDETVYMLPIPLDKSDNLNKGFQIMEDWAFNALLTDKDINEERGVIIEEYRLGLGADKRMRDKWLPQIFAGSRYADRLPIGKLNVLETFKPETLRQFHKDWYRPNLMALVVVGDINVDEIEKKIKTHFEKYENPKNAPERINYNLNNYKDPRIAIESDKEAPYNFIMQFNSQTDEKQPLKTIGDYKNYLMQSLFTQMVNARLDEVKNNPNPPFTYASVRYGGLGIGRNKDAYTSYAVTSADKIKASYQRLAEENQRIKEHGFLVSELERAKSNMMTAMQNTYENRDKLESGQLVGQYINHFLEQEPIPSIEWEFETYKQILPTIELNKVNQLVTQFIHPDNLAVVVTGPEKSITDTEISNILANISKTKLLPYQDDSKGLVLMAEKPKSGEIIDVMKDDKTGFTYLKLSNGVTVVYKNTDFKNDEIVMSGFRYGGTSLWTDEEYLKTNLALDAVSEAGINKISKNNLEKVLAGKTVSVSTHIGELSENVSGSSNKKDFETLFQLIYLNFLKTNHDVEVYNSYKQRMEAIYSSLSNKPEYYFQNEFFKFLGQNDPRNQGFIPTEENWKNTDYGLTYQKYTQAYKDAADFRFYFVGNIDDNQIKELSKTYLASLPATSQTYRFKDRNIPLLKGTQNKIYKKGLEDKSFLYLIFTGYAPYNQDEDMAISILTKVLDIKLTELLREEKGGVYSVGIRGDFKKLPQGEYSLTFRVPTSPERVEEMKNLCLQELHKIVKNGVEDIDFKKVQEEMLLNYKEDLKDNNYWLGEIENNEFNQNNPQDILEYGNKVKNFDKKIIQVVADKYFSKDYISGILLPEDK